MVSTRNFHQRAIWADNANVNIPAQPQDGVAYRRTGLSVTQIGQGSRFNTPADSGRYNQFLFEISTLLEEIDKRGILGWSDQVDYDRSGAVVLGSDGIAYRQLRESGPGTALGAVDPLSDTNRETWALLVPPPTIVNPGGGAPTDGAVPVGGIIAWSGAATSVPSGYALCDGNNGTPNLADRFILGTVNDAQVGTFGGANEFTGNTGIAGSHSHTFDTSTTSAGAHVHTLSGSTSSAGSHVHAISANTGAGGGHSHSGSVTVGNTSLSVSQIPAHSHSYSRRAGSARDLDFGGDDFYATRSTENLNTGSTGGGAPHSHSGSLSVDSVSNHTHTIQTNTQSAGAHSHTLAGSAASAGAHTHGIAGSTRSTGSHTHTITVDVLPRFYRLAWIMRTS